MKYKLLLVVALCALLIGCNAEVPDVDVSNIVLRISSEKIGKGETALCYASFSPDNATDKSVHWQVEQGSRFVSIEDNGDGTARIKGINPGRAVISATAANGKKAEVEVSVVFRIYSANDMKEFEDYVNHKSNIVDAELMNDIDMEGSYFEPIGMKEHPYTGEFDGKGHEIANIDVTSSDGYVFGLFGYAFDSRIHDLTITGDYFIYGNDNLSVGGFVADAMLVEIENCVSNINMTVTSTAVVNEGFVNVGGIIGFHKMGNVSNCENYGDIKVFSDIQSNGREYPIRIGGIIGCTAVSAPENAIRNCRNGGNVLSVNVDFGSLSVGGIVGESDQQVYQCSNTGRITGTFSSARNSGCEVGGIVGENIDVVEECYNTGVVESTNIAGGIVGYNMGSLGKINDCYNLGSMNGVRFINFQDLQGEEILHESVSNNQGISGMLIRDEEYFEAGGIVGSNYSQVSNSFSYSLDKNSSTCGICSEITDSEWTFIKNSYYSRESYSYGVGTMVDVPGQWTGLTNNQFANGELLYLLNKNGNSLWKQGENHPILTWQN